MKGSKQVIMIIMSKLKPKQATIRCLNIGKQVGGRRKRQIERVIDSGTAETEVFMPFCGATLISEQVEKSTRIQFSTLLAIKSTISSSGWSPLPTVCTPIDRGKVIVSALLSLLRTAGCVGIK